MIAHPLQSLYDLSFSQAVRIDYLWFPLIECVHVIAFSLVIGSIFIVDLRLLGITSSEKPVTELMAEVLPWTWGAFAVAVVAGSLLFVSKAPNYFANEFFRAKMLLIALAGVNMLVFHRWTFRGVKAWDRGAPTPLPAKLAGGISIALWAGVITCARWIGYTLM